jgi:tRNA modification GTPase
LTDTIAAVATAPGRGGVGIIRISGSLCPTIARQLLGFVPQARNAHYCDFKDTSGRVLDQGIALYFPNPHSFTGEDVLELQGHGGPVILDMLLSEVTSAGARLARPGEFSERAFLNDKLDLAQAEAIADLIEASSSQAARQALNSLQGEFSRRVNGLVEELIHLRIYVEAAIDFPEEEVDFLSDGKIATQLNDLCKSVDNLLASAQQGALLREGMKVVIAGRPNAGKSSLLNALAQKDIAIVTDIAGTTRDVLREHIHLDGMPLHIIDTAGLRTHSDKGANKVEQIGIERAWNEINQADRILLIIDSTVSEQRAVEDHWPEFFTDTALRNKLTIVYNKVDQSQLELTNSEETPVRIALSALTGAGLEELTIHLKETVGFEGTTEGGFSARRRHIDAIKRAQQLLGAGQTQLQDYAAGELLAEDLRQAQEALSEITGNFTSDDLLGRIFGSFCIGK